MSDWKQTLFGEPLFAIAVTVLIYLGAQALHARWRWLHPLLAASVGVMVVLALLDVPYESYAVGGSWIEFWLGPATVALGVPLYKHAAYIRKQLPAILGGIAVGTMSAMASAAALVWLLGGTKELMLTMMPKSATAPISIEVVRQLGGQPELGAVLTVLTGLLGSMIGPRLLRMAGLGEPLSLGAAIGTSSHGIGTARVLRESELVGGVSGFSMGVAGILTSIYAVPLYLWGH
ncbi:LrgB family protein [Cohnella cholangitidis]|uniref:LrgB family protein n=1 Tax=Cohnella cholangitidis TaxID=2598458 RepID=A0A7G5BYX7_9BACL|nr:LrgB family protein [Cohnella cholangitidis]QMV42161.1 LrgB family protein [Cohnella cholangitidis]